MSISAEERNYLVEQVESLTGKRPLFYLKFCSCKEFAQDVCNGKLYANTAEFFRQKEIETGERGQGDQFELLLALQTLDITMCDSENGNIIFTFPKANTTFRFKDDDIIPLVSFVGIPFSETNITYADENHAEFMLPFTDEEYNNMSEKFGKYCVIIGAREIEDRIKSYCKNSECEYIFDKVEYCDQNRIDRIQAFNKSAKERFLYKNADLSYQREYRLAIGIEIPKEHFIEIGCISSAVIVETNELKNLLCSVRYGSHHEEE